jgi:NTP pyrophosphatase (non-canonical NTP hydrolase)
MLSFGAVERYTIAEPPGDSAAGCGGLSVRYEVCQAMTIREFQQLIDRMYSDKDRKRGAAATFIWLMEEVGELAAAVREGTHQEKSQEFADVLAWLVTLANVEGVDLQTAVAEKYGTGCPGCGKLICTCDSKP